MVARTPSRERSGGILLQVVLQHRTRHPPPIRTSAPCERGVAHDLRSSRSFFFALVTNVTSHVIRRRPRANQ
jgi:hypothetical protein